MSDSLYAVRLFTRDFPPAVAFYRDTIGWPLRFESAEHAGRFVGVSIRVDDVHARYAELVERGVRFQGPPERQPWGGTLAHFEDLDGNVPTLLGVPERGQ